MNPRNHPFCILLMSTLRISVDRWVFMNTDQSWHLEVPNLGPAPFHFTMLPSQNVYYTLSPPQTSFHTFLPSQTAVDLSALIRFLDQLVVILFSNIILFNYHKQFSIGIISAILESWGYTLKTFARKDSSRNILKLHFWRLMLCSCQTPFSI